MSDGEKPEDAPVDGEEAPASPVEGVPPPEPQLEGEHGAAPDSPKEGVPPADPQLEGEHGTAPDSPTGAEPAPDAEATEPKENDTEPPPAGEVDPAAETAIPDPADGSDVKSNNSPKESARSHKSNIDENSAMHGDGILDGVPDEISYPSKAAPSDSDAGTYKGKVENTENRTPRIAEEHDDDDDKDILADLMSNPAGSPTAQTKTPRVEELQLAETSIVIDQAASKVMESLSSAAQTLEDNLIMCKDEETRALLEEKKQSLLDQIEKMKTLLKKVDSPPTSPKEEAPCLSGKMVYSLSQDQDENGCTTLIVGADNEADVVLRGLGDNPQAASITYDGQKMTLKLTDAKKSPTKRDFSPSVPIHGPGNSSFDAHAFTDPALKEMAKSLENMPSPTHFRDCDVESVASSLPSCHSKRSPSVQSNLTEAVCNLQRVRRQVDAAAEGRDIVAALEPESWYDVDQAEKDIPDLRRVRRQIRYLFGGGFDALSDLSDSCPTPKNIYPPGWNPAPIVKTHQKVGRGVVPLPPVQHVPDFDLHRMRSTPPESRTHAMSDVLSISSKISSSYLSERSIAELSRSSRKGKKSRQPHRQIKTSTSYDKIIQTDNEDPIHSPKNSKGKENEQLQDRIPDRNEQLLESRNYHKHSGRKKSKERNDNEPQESNRTRSSNKDYSSRDKGYPPVVLKPAEGSREKERERDKRREHDKEWERDRDRHRRQQKERERLRERERNREREYNDNNYSSKEYIHRKEKNDRRENRQRNKEHSRDVERSHDLDRYSEKSRPDPRNWADEVVKAAMAPGNRWSFSKELPRTRARWEQPRHKVSARDVVAKARERANEVLRTEGYR